jgi:hypothetical protein
LTACFVAQSRLSTLSLCLESLRNRTPSNFKLHHIIALLSNHNCYAYYIGIFLFLTISFYVQKLSISPGKRSVSKSIDNPEFLSWRFTSVGFTIVLKHRASLVRGGPHLSAKNVYDGFLLMWCNLKFEGVLFRSDSRHNYRVDSLDCATKQAVKLLGASSPWGKKGWEPLR